MGRCQAKKEEEAWGRSEEAAAATQQSVEEEAAGQKETKEDMQELSSESSVEDLDGTSSWCFSPRAVEDLDETSSWCFSPRQKNKGDNEGCKELVSLSSLVTGSYLLFGNWWMRQEVQRKAKQRAPAPAAEADESAAGAYLIYQTTNYGQMILVWSKVAVENALAFGRPQKIVPAFKFAQDGHWELTRNIQSDKQTWYLGWVMFVKACAAFDCEVVDFGLTGDAAPMPTSLWLWSAEGGAVSAVVKGEPFDTRDFTVVAACHAYSKDLRVQNISRDVFENQAKYIGDCTALR